MAPSKPSKSKKGMGCLLLFALPFAGVGVFMTGLTLWTVLQYVEAQQWKEVPATILHAELEEHRGDDSTTYQVVARYRYSYLGRMHTGTRVGLHGGSDNIGSFHQDAHRELSQHQKSGQPFPCYVNPDDPSESLLYRDLRWGLLALYTVFALVFGGVGFGLMAGGIYGYRKVQAEEKNALAQPEEPWLWKEEWAGGEITSSNKTLLLFAGIFALFWNLISAPLLFLLPGEIIENENYLALLGLLFPLVGAGLLIWAGYLLFRWRKYGESVFQMAEVPGVIGGKLAGVIRTKVKLRPEEGFKLTLNCINKYRSGSGKNRSTREKILWQDEQVIIRELAEHDPTQSAIPVAFAIPYDARPTDTSNTNNQTIWRLEAQAAVPGIDYHARFDVPVFRTPESRSDFVLDDSLTAEYAAPEDPALQLRAAGVERVPVAGGNRYVFPMGRHLGASLGITAFLVIWTGAIVLMWHLGAPIFFPIVFGLFELLLLYAAVDLWLYRSTIEASPAGLAVRSGFLVLGQPQWVPVDDIESIAPKSGMQSGNKVYYGIAVKRHGGKDLTAAKRLPSQRHAEAVIAEIEKDLARRESR